MVSAPTLEALRGLVSPYGVLGSSTRMAVRSGEPAVTMWGCHVGWPERLANDPLATRRDRDGVHARSGMSAAGSSWADTEEAELTALAEGLERYSGYAHHPDAVLLASVDELGAEALDLSLLPALSDEEYARPGQVLARPEPDTPIRWLAAWSLTEDRRVYVPAVTCWFGVPPRKAGERIWLPTSTGYAVHTEMAAACVAALNECVERDALSVLWLRRLPIPRLVIDDRNDVLSAALDTWDRSLVDPPLLFDATTELGIPTIYGLSRAAHHRSAAVVVACATHPDPVRAATKVLGELSMVRRSANGWTHVPADPEDCVAVEDGAAWTGRPEHAAAFDFLCDTPHERKLSELPDIRGGDARADLRVLLERCRGQGIHVLAVEVTTDEARDIGFRAVRVLVPQLVPLSFRHTARFLGHPRVLDAHERLGYPECARLPVNPYPQPMA